MQNHPVIKLIQQSNYIPEIPKAFGEALNMLLEPFEFSMDECIERLNNVPGLETALIQVLNYTSTLNREFLTLKDAVLYLGAKNIRMIAIAYITRLLLPNSSGRAKIFNNRTYWKHCIGTSIASHMIAAKTGLCDRDRIFTYGLIHDIGITVLDICLPDHLDRIYTMQIERGIHQIAAEKIVLGGITHSEIGMWLCDEWGLPDEIKEIVGCHHYPFKNGNAGDEIKIIYLADSVSSNYYERLLGTDTTFIYTERTKKLLNLPKEFIEDMANKLPEEVAKVNSIIDFDLF
ncbi:MAG: HDOD domain-containing protein [Clostridiaceae bacterium]|nr:HDOD domain-containing protein [Clostridiaceae bacterium]